MSSDLVGTARLAPPGARQSGSWAVLMVCLIAWVGGVPAVVASGVSDAVGAAVAAVTTSADAPMTEDRAADAYATLPLSFEPNVGQADAGTRFVSRSGGYALALAPTSAVLALNPTSPLADPGTPGAMPDSQSTPRVLAMTLVGADPAAAMTATEPLTGTVNYLVGDDPSAWQVGVPTYGRIDTAAVYPGIDVSWYGNGGALEYDFRLAPGADPGVIRIDFDGARHLSVGANGDLNVETDAGPVVQRAPVLYQDIDGGRRAVAGHYVLTGEHQVGFAVGAYDRAHALVIDPVLAYSTYLGGAGQDFGLGIAVDDTGAAYVMGYTASTDFPTANPLQAANAGGFDAFVAKLNPAGSALVYATYLGGTGNEVGTGIAVDDAGAAYFTGSTNSTDFPTASPLQAANAGGTDAFVAKLNPAGSALVYATYLGGSANDGGNDIAVDDTGAASVTGVTNSTDFPTASPMQAANAGGGDAFVTKLDPGGSALVYSTYLGGSGTDGGFGIFVDDTGATYVTGRTTFTDFPTASPLQAANAGGTDAFVAKLNPAGSALVYATYLGGSANDEANGIAVDDTGAASVTGETTSSDFPTASPLQATNAGGTDAFVAKLNPAGSALVHSTYLGGTGEDEGTGIAVDATGTAYVTGYTASTDFPTANPLQPANAGGDDAFVAKISSTVGPTCLGMAATIVGTAGNDRIFGTAGPDVIMGLGGNDSIYGYGGDDVICGGDGNDVLDGGAGNDTIDGEAGDDRVIGGLGNDDVRGGDGSDRVFGNAGTDQVSGGANVDYCYGGTGTNTFATCEIYPQGTG